VLVNIKVHSALENSAAQMTDKDIFIPAGSAAKDHMDMDIRLRPGPIHIAQHRWGFSGQLMVLTATNSRHSSKTRLSTSYPSIVLNPKIISVRERAPRRKTEPARIFFSFTN
jgi:hypothetical protein